MNEIKLEKLLLSSSYSPNNLIHNLIDMFIPIKRTWPKPR